MDERRKAYLMFEVLMLVILIGLNIAFLNNFSVWTIPLKSVSSLFFVLAEIYSYIRNKNNRQFSRFMLIGFCCCVAGDVFLALNSSGVLFVLGVTSFAVAYVLFSIAFCRVCPISEMDILVTVVLFEGCIFLLSFRDFELLRLFPVLIGCVAVASFMVVKAVSVWPCCQEEKSDTLPLMIPTIIFDVFFLLLDMALLFMRFGIGVEKGAQLVNWVLYYLAYVSSAVALNEMKEDMTD